MTKEQKIRYSTLLFLTLAAGTATLFPHPFASEKSILGYRALCSFSPISSVLLFYGSLLLYGRIKRG